MLNIFQFFNKLNDSFGIQIEYPKFKELEEADIAVAQEFADHWEIQCDRADRYTKLIRQGTLDKVQAQAYYIERIGPLEHQTKAILQGAHQKALGEARKYSKLMKGAE